MIDVADLRTDIDFSMGPVMEYTDWRDENLSSKRTAFVGDWSWLDEMTVEGPDAFRFLSEHAVNSFARFDIAQAKHAIFCNAAGKVIGDGVLMRHAADRFEFNSRGPVINWLEYRLAHGGYDARAGIGVSRFKFQVAGPAALAICEELTGEDLRGIAFMHYGTAHVAGAPVSLLRQGMAGEIGFELHGDAAMGARVHAAILDVGARHGLRRLGSRNFSMNHIEAAFPTVTHDYLPAIADAPERAFYERYAGTVPAFGTPDWFRSFHRAMKVMGSYEGDHVSDWYRSPIELGWGRNIGFDHDFHGRAALESEAAAPRRTRRTLVWDKRDVVAVYASFFEDDAEPGAFMEIPRDLHTAMIASKVMVGDRLVGVATARGYSYHFRKMISHVVIDIDCAEPGTEVRIIWGEPGGRQMPIRAVVAPSPYKTDNRRADLRALPAVAGADAS